jgi:hypothetical protein
VIYIAKLKDAVYVLHAFKKKSQKTSSSDLRIAKRRLEGLLRKQPVRGPRVSDIEMSELCNAVECDDHAMKNGLSLRLPVIPSLRLFMQRRRSVEHFQEVLWQPRYL